jgi:ferredoxin
MWELRMKVEVDHESCEASALCASLAPKVFELDNDDQLHVLPDGVPDSLAESVREAVRSCPQSALRLHE